MKIEVKIIDDTGNIKQYNINGSLFDCVRDLFEKLSKKRKNGYKL